MKPSRRGRGSRGFTLVEVVFTVGVLTIAALMLTAAIASSQQMSAIAREREVANNAVRSYTEQLRQLYPYHGSADLTSLVADGQYAATPAHKTPLDFVPASFIEKGILKGAVATVQFTNDESGTNWDHCYTTDSTVAPVSSAMSAADKAGLGLGRDLDGDGAVSATPILLNKLLLVPCKVELSWISGAGTTTTTAARQKVTVYASFTPQH